MSEWRERGQVQRRGNCREETKDVRRKGSRPYINDISGEHCTVCNTRVNHVRSMQQIDHLAPSGDSDSEVRAARPRELASSRAQSAVILKFGHAARGARPDGGG